MHRKKRKGSEIVDEPLDDEQLKTYWEGIRQHWEESRDSHTLSMGYEAYKVRLLHALSPVQKSLEVGFGDGKWMKFLTKQGIEAYGIDILENAAIQLKKEGFLPVVADARYLPFEDNTFDLTYSFGVIEHFQGTETAISEHVRVTIPGGKIIITVPYLISPHTLYWMALHIKRGTYKKRPATFGKRYTIGQFKALLELHEVEHIVVEPFLFPIPTARTYYHENPLLNRFGMMLWTEMTKK